MLKVLLVCIVATSVVFGFSFSGFSKPPDEYNNAYCHDPEQLEHWNQIVEKSKGNDSVQALHALWIGLCLKVEYRQLTVDRANQIFDDARATVISSSPDTVKPRL